MSEHTVILRLTEEERDWLDEMRRTGAFLTDEDVLCSGLLHLARHFELRMPFGPFVTRRGKRGAA